MRCSIGGSDSNRTLRSFLCSCTILSIKQRYSDLAKRCLLLEYERKYHTRNIDAVFKLYVPNDIAIKLAKFGRVSTSTPTTMTCYFLCFRTKIQKETTKNTQPHINYYLIFSRSSNGLVFMLSPILFFRSGIFNSIAR